MKMSTKAMLRRRRFPQDSFIKPRKELNMGGNDDVAMGGKTRVVSCIVRVYFEWGDLVINCLKERKEFNKRGK